MSLRPVLCRVGSKAKFAKMLDAILPPHKIYVEPFVGSGAVFFYKEPAEKEVINDLNKGIVETYKLIQRIPQGSKFPNIEGWEAMRRFFNQDPKSDIDKLSWRLIEACGGWMSVPATREWLDTAAKRFRERGEAAGLRVVNPSTKMKNFEAYKERLDGVVIRNEDYEKVMREFDSKDTLFFCDPPYEGTSEGIGYAQQNEFDFKRFANVCSSVKGKVVITINDSPNIRELFKKFYIQGILITGKKSSKEGVGTKTRKELIITNFPFPKGWEKSKPSGVKLGSGKQAQLFKKEYGLDTQEGLSLEDISKATGMPLAALQEVYNRGVGAWETNIESVRTKQTFKKNENLPRRRKLPKEQWAMARVYSFARREPTTFGDVDAYIAEKYNIPKTRTGGSKRDFTMPNTLYLQEARKRAKAAGYDPEKLNLDTETDSKLVYTTPDGRTSRFGKKGYGDFILWSHAERSGDVPRGTAEMKRNVYQKSHSKIKGNWKKDKFSPNMLSLKINW